MRERERERRQRRKNVRRKNVKTWDKKRMEKRKRRRVCVIGCGPAGLVAIKVRRLKSFA